MSDYDYFQTDTRVKAITEVMSVLRMIKLFGWEGRVKEGLDEKRNFELRVIFKRKMLELLNSNLNHIIPLVHLIVTYGTFTIVMKKELSASIVFSSMAGFGMLRQQIFMITHFIPGLITANVSLKRLQDFLTNTELLDGFAAQESGIAAIDASAAHAGDIGVSAASFAWSAADVSSASVTPGTPGGLQTPSGKGRFRLRIEDEVVFHKGAINLIVGPTGSGKSSFLMALLGEMHYLPDGPGSWVNLPRAGGIAYASQESWVQNETIRDNILFGSPYDEERYKKVIYQCGLKRDLSLFEAGDATEVGEKGLTLSGGQKARITLARAVYSRAEVLLLDDVLAALDVHTSKWIVQKCLQGELVRGRTVLLVTHNVALAAPVAAFVVSLGADGRILSQGSVSDAVARDARLARDMDKGRKAMEQDDAEGGADLDAEAAPDSKGKLIVEEEVAEGHVGWDAFKLFVNAVGGSWSTLFWLGYIVIAAVAEVSDAGETVCFSSE
jgi:ABC-type multidrug transport system fused ATPase/permease subunit